MKKVLVRVPMRADLAGGTLDLWPLHLFQDRACTVNVAISYHAECEVSTIDDDNLIEVALLDLDYRQRYHSFQELANDPKVALVYQVLAHFRLSGVRVVTRSDAPRGSGLGASSALSVALLRAVSEVVGQPLEGNELIPLVRDLETRLIGIPAGVQDYYPPVFGGLASLRLEPGRVVRQQLPMSLTELAKSLVIHYSGISHFSGLNNWEIYKRFLDGNKKVRRGLARIAATATHMEQAFEAQDLNLVGKLLGEEWENRKALIPGVSNPEIERIIEIAMSSGAIGAKVCGAGGGGCVAMIVDPERRDEVVERLGEAPGFTVAAVPVPYGLESLSPDDSLTSRKQASWRLRPKDSDIPIEELWVATDGAQARKPYLMAEASVTFDASRRGAVHTANRLYVAPIRSDSERVEWALLRRFRDEDLELITTSPLISPDARNVESALRVADEAIRDLPEQIAERERMTLFHNAALGLLSEPSETKEEFLERCLETAREQARSEYERLEATFRLKVEQVRERYEREHRASLDEDSGTGRDGFDKAPAFPWGQVVHDILSGRDPSTPDPSNPMQSDLLEKIKQHRKHWLRDVEEYHERVRAVARDIETIDINPDHSEVSIDRRLIVWARGLESFPPAS
ncbi:MAG: hypothetical protein KY432_01870 [Acidobacteria bacterium]|nr:hypothetical protein [Acidobacteriota bacterium]